MPERDVLSTSTRVLAATTFTDPRLCAAIVDRLTYRLAHRPQEAND